MNSGVLDQLGTGARVAVVRLRSLGDSVLATPGVHLLKSARPDLEIAVVSEERFRGVWEGNPDVARVLEPSVGELRRFGPRLVLNLHGGTRSAQLTALSGARFRAGFGHYRHQWIYNVRIPRAQEILGEERKVHTAEHAASAMFYLGVPRGETPRARLFAEERSDGCYAVIHPVAATSEKTWPASRFVGVAKFLERELGLAPVFVAGPGEDISAFQMWRCVAGAGLEELKRLMAGASLFVGNDSGPAHVAAAFGVPVVVIFGPSDPVVWAPWRTEAEVLIADGPIENVSEERAMSAVERMRVHA